ncbi:GMC oxidoreductase [Limimaricola sp.]|uniref:GMC oxidoreductase n=1 Tax=Limimaricola sp. TaxID=2211665 RepID=UPI004059C0D3
MLLDAQELPDGEELEADICIVGGGVAGIILALELIDSPFKVILLESGGMYFDEKTQSLAAGPNLGFQYDALKDSRLRMLGGSSNHWSGHCIPLTPIDFEVREEIPHSGWPITYDDIAPYYARAQPYFELQTERPYDFDFWAEKIGLEPLPFDPELFTNIAMNESPPTLFGQAYAEDLAKAENVTTFLHANALELETNETATRVDAVQAACIDGPRFKVRAKRFALCMGGIEIPRLLLLSNAVAPAGLGNARGLVGRFFGDHAAVRPSLRFMAQRRQRDLGLYANQHYFDVGGFFAGIAVSDAALRREKLPGILFHIIASKASPGEVSLGRLYGGIRSGVAPPYLSAQVGNLFTDLDGVTNRLFRWATGDTEPLIDRDWYGPWLTFECVPNPDSTVHLVEERDLFGQRRIGLDWRLTDQELQTVKRGTDLFIRELGRLGIGRAWTEVLRDDYDWPAYVARGKHHCGTTRMSADPATGVVDAQGRVHGMSNLFISSSSVFPTMGYANPTLTIGALSIRMADTFRAAATTGEL